MDKKKMAVCTTLFVIILLAILIGSWFIKIADGNYRLSYALTEAIALVWVYDCGERFYKWLTK